MQRRKGDPSGVLSASQLVLWEWCSFPGVLGGWETHLPSKKYPGVHIQQSQPLSAGNLMFCWKQHLRSFLFNKTPEELHTRADRTIGTRSRR